MKWADRRFSFDLPEALFPVVVERLRGTPARIEDKVRGLSPAVLIRRDGGAWSIQEHIGHLLDLDELHAGRLDDFLAGAAVLRPADMTNRKTWEANHNARPIADLLRDFRRERERFVGDDVMVLLHGFVKKSQKTPPGDLRTARQRLMNLRKE
jgi:hypothetical protein